MPMNRRTACGLIASSTFATLAGDHAQAAEADRFAGFPPLGKYRQTERTLPVITSDGVANVLRPKWTRAMADLGGWPTMFRFHGDIYFVFYHGDGHRYKQHEATNRLITLRSRDEGKTWTETTSCPPNDPAKFQGTPEFVAAGDTLFCYDFNSARQTQVRTSTDGSTWSEPRDCYKAPFYFWGVIYDPVSKLFWCPPHAIPHVGTSSERQVHLIKSQDGVNWEFVSQVAPFDNSSESTLRFEADRTMTVIVRRKYGKTCNVAVAKPPYTNWEMSERPLIAEGEHFYEIGGKTYLASRASYRGNDPRVLANPKVFDDRKSYSTIYRWNDRQLVEMAVMDSMGDCSYPHLIETPDEVLCGYYSQHENGLCKAYLCAFDKQAFLKQA